MKNHENEEAKRKAPTQTKKEKGIDYKDLNIYPIKIEDDKLNQGDSKYPLSSPVHFHIVVGRVKAGKSVLMNNLYLSKRLFGGDFQTRILISSTAYNDAVNKYLLDEFDFVFNEYSDSLLEEILNLIQEDEGDGRFLLLLDDIIGSVNFKRVGADPISSLISHYRHIGNGENEGKLSICMASQYWKYFNPICRNNCTAYYILGSFPESEIKKMAQDLSYFGGSDDEFLRLYKESRSKGPYDFLYLSVEHLEARRNHTDLLWSQKDGQENKEEKEKEGGESGNESDDEKTSSDEEKK